MTIRVLALISLLGAATPSLWAQGEHWEKLMKAADKDYLEGLKEKYLHGWGSDYPYPHFVKAEKDLLAALAETQTFSAKDLRIPQTQDTLANVYRQEGK